MGVLRGLHWCTITTFSTSSKSHSAHHPGHMASSESFDSTRRNPSTAFASCAGYSTRHLGCSGVAGSASTVNPAQARGTVQVARRRRTARITPSCRVRRCPRLEISVPESLFLLEPLRKIDGSELDFSKLKGKVVLAVNVASEDERAEDHFEILNGLYKKFSKAGLEIIAFPSNWFGQYEPGSDEEVAERIAGFDVKFTVMSKLSNFDVEANPVLEMGIREYPGDVIWNFAGKFLFDKSGKPVGRYDLLSSADFIEEKIAEKLRG